MTPKVDLADRVLGTLPIMNGPLLGELAKIAHRDGRRGRAARKMLANYAAREEVVRATEVGLRTGLISVLDFSLTDAIEFFRFPLSVAVEILVVRAAAPEPEVDSRFLDQLSWEASLRRPKVEGRPSPWPLVVKLLRINAHAQRAIASDLERRLRTLEIGPAWYPILRMAEIVACPCSSLVSAIVDVVFPTGHLELTDIAICAVREMIRRGAKLSPDQAERVTRVARR